MNKTTSMNDQKLKNLRRKLFFLAGYLIVAGVLFAYVSYSQYRLTVKGAVMMPQTYTMNASLNVTNTTGAAASLSATTSAVTANIDGFLDAVRPGDNAETLASVTDSTESHYFNIQICNWETVSGQAVISPLDMEYELYVETEGLLPLDFILKDADGTNTLASAASERTLTSTSIKFTNNGTAFKDQLTGSAIGTVEQSKTYRIYVGWNNEASSTTTQSIALSKELDKIRIKAVITALEAPSTSYESTSGPAVDQEHTYTTTDAAIQERLNKE